MKEYTILFATDPSSLSSQVNNLMKTGWEAQGGVTISESRGDDDDEANELWAQAMVKRQEA